MAVLSGARAKIYFKNVQGSQVLAGYATGVTANENHQLQRVNVLGNLDSSDIIPVSRSVDVRCDFVRISENTLRSQGLWPQGATLDVLNFPELTMSVQDVDGSVIFQIEGIRCENRSFTTQSGSIMTVNATFQAKTLKETFEI